MNIVLRKLSIEDLEEYKFWKLPIHEYHQFNGPYFKKSNDKEVEVEIQQLQSQFENGNVNPLPFKRLIVNQQNQLLGEVSFYWKSEETNWMELGIVIFSKDNWGKGIGKKALELWIEELFKLNKELVRLGISTWSGNYGMISLAEKVGMIKEAQCRKARIIDGQYYDSISYGILRTEWESITK